MTAFMLFYELCRATRMLTKCTATAIRLGNKFKRIEKDITNTQKRWASIYQRLDNQKSLEIKQAQLKNQQYAYNTTTVMGIASSIFDQQKNAISQNGVDTSGDNSWADCGSFADLKNSNASVYNSFISQAQQYIQGMLQQQSMVSEQSITAKYDYIKTQLEYQEQEALAPLEYEQVMLEADKNAAEADVEYYKEYKQNLKQQYSEASKDAVPKFGIA